jgi:outer membrane receptor protein involved in Fe transport
MRTKLFIAAIMLFLNSITANMMAKAPTDNIYAGQGNVSGKIIDSNTKSAMEFVTVVLHSVSDSTVISGTVTDMDGKFMISNLANGSYYIEINFMGFDKKIVQGINLNESNNKIDLGDISLEPMTNLINEVTVTGEKAKIEYKLDKRIVNVDKNLNAQGGTAISALENTPSVQVDAQGNLTLRGSSDYVVLIDGKPSVVKGSDALKQIPASAIEQIEVITNPSAKYDADGNAGIINVISKKDKLQGFSGTLSASTSNTNSSNANALINYRKGKLNYFAGFDFANNTYNSTIDIDNITIKPTGNERFVEDVKQFNSNDNLSFKTGFDFDLNEKNSFSVSASKGIQGYDHGSNARLHRWDNQLLNSFTTSNNYTDVAGDVLNFTADYRHKFADDHTLALSAVYGSWDGIVDNWLIEMNANEYYEEGDLASQLNSKKDEFSYQFRVNIDYTRPLKTGKLELGTQFRYESRIEDLLFRNYDVASSTWTKNDLYSYHQNYANSIYSGYVIFSDKLLGVDYQLGVRSEFFTRNIEFDTESNPFIFDKFMLYPSVHLSKKISEKHQLQFSYGRRINRPQPWILNNNPSYIDPYNIFKGNPNLKFEYIDAFELNYRALFKKFSLSTQTYLRNTTNAFTAIRVMDSEGIMNHLLTNADSQVAFGVEQGANVEVTKWWSLSANVNIYNYTLKTMISNSEKTQKINSWDANFVSNFNFKTGTRFQAMAYYRSKGVDAMGETTGAYTINLSANQSFFKGKLNAGISAQNLFNTLIFDYTVTTDQFDNLYRIGSEGPVFVVNLSYNFNNFQQKKRGRKDDIDFKGGGGF